jgi:hypothetical protein
MLGALLLCSIAAAAVSKPPFDGGAVIAELRELQQRGLLTRPAYRAAHAALLQRSEGAPPASPSVPPTGEYCCGHGGVAVACTAPWSQLRASFGEVEGGTGAERSLRIVGAVNGVNVSCRTAEPLSFGMGGNSSKNASSRAALALSWGRSGGCGRAAPPRPGIASLSVSADGGAVAVRHHTDANGAGDKSLLLYRCAAGTLTAHGSRGVVAPELSGTVVQKPEQLRSSEAVPEPEPGADEGEGGEQPVTSLPQYNNVLCLTVVGLVLLTIFFEKAKDFLCEYVGEDIQQLMEHLFGELTILGFIGLTSFLAVSRRSHLLSACCIGCPLSSRGCAPWMPFIAPR